VPAKGDGITKRKDGRYMGRYVVHTPDGPKRKTVYGAKYRDVEKKLNELRSNADRGIVYEDESLTVGTYLRRWLADSVKDTVRQRTYEGYEHVAERHIVPTLGRLKLKNLTPAHVRGLYRERLDSGLSPRTVQYAHTTLNKALKQAVADGLIPRNAAASVKAPRPRPTEIRPLDRKQVRTFLDSASDHRLEALYVVAVTAGLREGELLALRWEDVDLEAATPTLHVRRTLSEARSGRIFEAPKSGKGRQVRLTRTAAEALKGHRISQNEEKLATGARWQDHGLVFPSSVGTPMGARNLTRHFKGLLKGAGLPQSFRFHDLRHTCATLLLRQGVHVKYVQELLGHADISLTLNVYSHILPDMGDAAAGAMDAALGQT
jgi:integrase